MIWGKITKGAGVLDDNESMVRWGSPMGLPVIRCCHFFIFEFSDESGISINSAAPGFDEERTKKEKGARIKIQPRI